MKTFIETLGRALLLLGICPLSHAIAGSAPDASAAPQEVEKKQKLDKKEKKQEGEEKKELTAEEKAIKEAKAERDRALAKAEEDYQKALAEVRQGSGGEEAKEAKKQELAKQYRDQREAIMKAFVQKVSSLKGNSENPPKGDNPPGERGKGNNPPVERPNNPPAGDASKGKAPTEVESKLLAELEAENIQHERAMKGFAEREKSIRETAKGDELAAQLRELEAQRTAETARHNGVGARIRSAIGDKRFDELMAQRPKPKSP